MATQYPMRLAAHRAPHRVEGESDGHLSGRFARERDGLRPHRGGDTTFSIPARAV
jgi:hypothetical protein